MMTFGLGLQRHHIGEVEHKRLLLPYMLYMMCWLMLLCLLAAATGECFEFKDHPSASQGCLIQNKLSSIQNRAIASKTSPKLCVSSTGMNVLNGDAERLLIVFHGQIMTKMLWIFS